MSGVNPAAVRPQAVTHPLVKAIQVLFVALAVGLVGLMLGGPMVGRYLAVSAAPLSPTASNPTAGLDDPFANGRTWISMTTKRQLRFHDGVVTATFPVAWSTTTVEGTSGTDGNENGGSFQLDWHGGDVHYAGGKQWKGAWEWAGRDRIKVTFEGEEPEFFTIVPG